MSPTRPIPDASGAARPSTPIPAATVVLLRPGPGGLEVLLTKRPPTMAFGPGIHVFPGGRLDPADAAPEALAASRLDPDEAARRMGLGLAPHAGLTPAAALAHHVAAVRETREETGIQVAARDLIPLSRWVTPASLARRFDARFFAAFVAPGTEIRPGSSEVAEAAWLTAADALAAAGRGELETWQPTLVTLQQLAGLDGPDAVRAAFAPGAVAGGPGIERLDEAVARVDAAWAGGIPGRRGPGLIVGAGSVVVVDPADPTGLTTMAIQDDVATSGRRLAGVVVTGFEPERHAGVEMFAHGLGLPVASPAGLAAWVPYPRLELGVDEPIPFAEPGVTLEAVIRLRDRTT